MKIKLLTILLGSLVFGGVAIGQTSKETDQQKLEKVLTSQEQVNSQSAQAQKKVSDISEETRKLLDEYRMTLRKIDNTKIYNSQLEKLLADQQQEMKAIQMDIDSIRTTQREVVPLMMRMIATMEKFVQFDIPFLMEERQDRIAKLKAMMNRADVSTSEKFRRVLEAYQIENDFGRTIEAYRGLHQVNGKDLTVDFLRIGRLALIYQTLDGKQSGQWMPQQKQWLPLDDSYAKSIRKGLRIARKETAPDLMKLPIQTAGVKQ